MSDEQQPKPRTPADLSRPRVYCNMKRNCRNRAFWHVGVIGMTNLWACGCCLFRTIKDGVLPHRTIEAYEAEYSASLVELGLLKIAKQL